MVSAGCILADRTHGQAQELFMTIAACGFFWGQVVTCILVRRAGVKGADLVVGQSPFIIIWVTVAAVFKLLN